MHRGDSNWMQWTWGHAVIHESKMPNPIFSWQPVLFFGRKVETKLATFLQSYCIISVFQEMCNETEMNHWRGPFVKNCPDALFGLHIFAAKNVGNFFHFLWNVGNAYVSYNCLSHYFLKQLWPWPYWLKAGPRVVKGTQTSETTQFYAMEPSGHGKQHFCSGRVWIGLCCDAALEEINLWKTRCCLLRKRAILVPDNDPGFNQLNLKDNFWGSSKKSHVDSGRTLFTVQ